MREVGLSTTKCSTRRTIFCGSFFHIHRRCSWCKYVSASVCVRLLPCSNVTNPYSHCLWDTISLYWTRERPLGVREACRSPFSLLCTNMYLLRLVGPNKHLSPGLDNCHPSHPNGFATRPSQTNMVSAEADTCVAGVICKSLLYEVKCEKGLDATNSWILRKP